MNRCLLLLGAVAVAANLSAQDYTVGEPVWYAFDLAPDQLPKPKRRLNVDYPDELREAAEVGYVIVTRYVDADGQTRMLEAHGTHTPFQRAVELAFQDWSFTAAHRNGRPVDGTVWLPVIFNPKSAAPNGADATPRLLSVAPAFLMREPPPAGGLPPVIPLRLKLDATGAIVEATPLLELNTKQHRAVERALESWRFAPARRASQAVEAELVVPMLCFQPPVPAAGFAPAKAVNRETPIYPYAMRRYGLEGRVTVDFVVDETGKVRNAFVVSSTNPAFDANALKAIREWKFAPATHNGRPTVVHQQLPMIFRLDEGGGVEPFSVRKGNQAKLPPELRYDTPPKIRNVQIPVYPYEQMRAGKSGSAKIAMAIDQRGKVAQVKVISADQPEFGYALTAAVEGFMFDPALKDGKPVENVLTFEQDFNRHELPDADPDSLLSLEKRHPERIVAGDKLDAPLKPLSRRPPIFPVSVPAETVQGEAEIECLVDQEGQVRLPRIFKATHPAFGYAAVQAVATWAFEPPTSGGKGAVVRVRVPIKFDAKVHPAIVRKPSQPEKPAAETSDAAQ